MPLLLSRLRGCLRSEFRRHVTGSALFQSGTAKFIGLRSIQKSGYSGIRIITMAPLLFSSGASFLIRLAGVFQPIGNDVPLTMLPYHLREVF
jgi:hypothetical protein